MEHAYSLKFLATFMIGNAMAIFILSYLKPRPGHVWKLSQLTNGLDTV